MVDDLLCYLSAKFPKNEYIMMLYGSYYHQKACRTRKGTKISGKYVKQAEKAYKASWDINQFFVKNTRRDRKVNKDEK